MVSGIVLIIVLLVVLGKVFRVRIEFGQVSEFDYIGDCSLILTRYSSDVGLGALEIRGVL